jgi:hypothetical protein
MTLDAPPIWQNAIGENDQVMVIDLPVNHDVAETKIINPRSRGQDCLLNGVLRTLKLLKDPSGVSHFTSTFLTCPVDGPAWHHSII